nr:immunoglobulin light chain junction region [Macaca mulatta]
CLQYNSVPLSF